MTGSRRHRVPSALVGAALVVFLAAIPTGAQSANQPSVSSRRDSPLRITVDMAHQVVKTGDSIEFETLVTNGGAKGSPSMVLAMNIVNLGSGDPVDPEDWSPERTQSIDLLAPGESSTNPWVVDAILDGDYMVYITVIPAPESAGTTSQPVTSSGIHLSVAKFIRLNPNGVLPIAIAMPVGLMLCMFGLRWIRRRRYGESDLAEE